MNFEIGVGERQMQMPVTFGAERYGRSRGGGGGGGGDAGDVGDLGDLVYPDESWTVARFGTGIVTPWEG